MQKQQQALQAVGCAPLLPCESQIRHLHTVPVLMTTDFWAGSAHPCISWARERQSTEILWAHKPGREKGNRVNA